MKFNNVAENIAGDVVTFISLYLPYISEDAVQSRDKKQIEYVKRAKRLWSCILRTVEKGKISKTIVDDFKKEPDNIGAQIIFRHQLTGQLKEDELLAHNIQEILY